MKKILLVITKGEVGGAQMSVMNLAKGLTGKNYEVGVIFGEGSFLTKELTKHKIKFWQFKHLKRTHNPLKNLLFAIELYKFLKNNRFNIVHFNSSNTLTGAMAVKLFDKKIKTVFTFRGMSMLDNNYETAWLLKKAYITYFKFYCNFIDENVFVSQENFQFAKESKLVKRGSYIYNGLQPDEVIFKTKDEARKKMEAGLNTDFHNKFIIGSIGRLAYQKNYEFLISIFPEILKIKPNAIAIIIGDGPEKDNYRELTTKNKLSKQIFFMGSIEHASSLIKGFDLFVLPSRYEGLSITLIESLMAEAPILASAVGGNAEMINDERQIFKLNDNDDFIKKFSALTGAPEVLESASQKNSESSKIFHIDNTVNNYLKLYFK